MKKRNIIYGTLLLLNVFLLFWSVNYLIAYASQNISGAAGFGFITGMALLGITLIGLKWLHDNQV